jgi:hypothetical protein
MARYEEMDELLERVRERMAKRPAPVEPSAEEARSLLRLRMQDAPEPNLTEAMQGLLNVARGLRDLLAPESVELLPSAQQEELLVLLRKVLHELQTCQNALQRPAPQD